MPPRHYRQARRAESAEETRRRIVEATFALHEEQGIATTSMKQIAARAGVSVGTVYHHFPTYDDAVQACGDFTLATVPLPDQTIFDGLDDAPSRVERLVAAVFTYFARLPVYDRARCDQDLVLRLRDYVAAEEQRRRLLIGAALGPGADQRRVDAAAALTDASVLRALARAGWSPEEAAGEVTRIIVATLIPA